LGPQADQAGVVFCYVLRGRVLVYARREESGDGWDSKRTGVAIAAIYMIWGLEYAK
jgi:hypothetical protein